MNMKKIVLTSIAALTMFSATVFPALAAGKAAPKATGGVGYDAYGLQRHAEFNAIETSNTCSYADVTGTYVFTFDYLGVPYPHDAFLTQTGTSVTGNGGYPVGGSYAYSWHVTSGTVSINSISLSILYDTGAPGVVMTMTGTIAPDGTLSGTWTDNYGGTRTGTWASTSGTAGVFTGCTGKSTFNYHDADGNFYKVSVQYVKVSGDKAWFAGPVVSGNVGAGNWLFAEVQDVGTPGSAGDLIWGSFTNETAAKTGVALMTDPGDGPFAVTNGNLQVH